ncbi:hypothetical protein ACIGHF_11550 [Stenotrophomonas sp. NPDC077464]|uniref:SpaN/EivJ family type III secretion system needle length determinant n=1 Tax=unclassified Stenotrophomonas TaxID=196198 RepID=UPI0037D330CD
MSVKIQPQPAAIAATGPVDAVSLSERVQAHPNPPLEVPYAEDAWSAPPEAVEVPDQGDTPDQDDLPDQVDAAVPREAAPDRSDAPGDAPRPLMEGPRALQPQPGHAAAASTSRIRMGMPSPQTATPSLATALPVAGKAGDAGAPVADASAAVPGRAPAVAGSTVVHTPGEPPATSAASTADAPHAAIASGAPQRNARALAARPVVPPAAAASPASPAAAPGAVISDSRTASAPVAMESAFAVDATAANPATSATATATPQPGGEPHDSQSLADARRAEANLGTRQLVRAARQAEALQTAMSARTVAGSQINVAFSSWGAGHSVIARLEADRLHMLPSSARVGNALAASLAPAGSDLVIAVDSSDSATDERRRRRDHQGHA